MKKIYLFPYEDVTPHTNVVLYGFGNVGKSFYYQIKQNHYCNIVAIIDKKYAFYEGRGVPVVSIDKICELSFDYVIVAIKKDSIGEAIVEKLVNEYNISEKNIVFKDYYDGEHEHEVEYKTLDVMPAYQIYSDIVSIAVFFSGGLGDCIIQKKAIEEIYRICQGKCAIDIFTCKNNTGYALSILNDLYYINAIYDCSVLYDEYKVFYDVGITTKYILTIDSINKDKLQQKNLHIYEVFQNIEKSISKYGITVRSWYADGVNFARCKFDGCNMYTMYNRYYGFCITDMKVNIPLASSYKTEFEQLRLPKTYITINYGWGDHNDDRPHIKVWPQKNFIKLVDMIKHAFPEVGVIQVGARDDFRIQGVDRFMFGKSLEVSKYVLKASILHIDCEGGLVHLATQLGTKCVVLFGPTQDYFFGYPQNINIKAGSCHDCYFLTYDVKKCLRGLKQPECMEAISPDIVFKFLQVYLYGIGVV